MSFSQEAERIAYSSKGKSFWNKVDELEKVIQQTLAEQGITKKIKNSEELKKEEKEFLEATREVSGGVKMLLEKDEEDLKELRDTIKELNRDKSTEKKLYNNLRKGMVGFHDDINDLVASIENQDGDPDRILDRIESHLDTVIDALENLLELDKKKSERHEKLDKVLLTYLEDVEEAKKVIQQFLSTYSDIKNGGGVLLEGLAERWHHEAESLNFRKKTSEKLAGPSGSPEEIYQNLMGLGGSHQIRRLEDELEEYIEHEAEIHETIEEQIRELITKDGNIQESLRNLIVREEDKLTEQQKERIEHLREAMRVIRSTLENIGKYEEDVEEEEKAFVEYEEAELSPGKLNSMVRQEVKTTYPFGMVKEKLDNVRPH